MCSMSNIRRSKYPDSYIYQSSKSTEVYWGHSSIVEAELLCLSDLLNNNRSWHYAINLAGSEMMTLTNFCLTCS